MKLAFQIIGIGLLGLVGLVVIGLVFLGTISPETSIYTGLQTPSRFVDEVRELDLLREDEKLVYFYSDALVNIKDGMYMITEDRLILYSTLWEEPYDVVIPFSDLVDLEVVYDDSFLTDSVVTVEDKQGKVFSFPLSSELGRDRKFVEHIQQRMPE